MCAFDIGMRDSIEMESSRGQTDDARLLVLGYRGTLRPLQSQNPPPAMETLLEPWLGQAWPRLDQHVPQQHRVFQDEPVPLRSLLPLLKDRLIGILTQALGADGITSGKSSASDMMREFPLLQALIRTAVCEWVAAIGTFLQRLHRDQAWLAASLRLIKLPPIESISATASDMHAGGHSVLRVCFQGGCCLYYKPRPLTGEWLWHHLVVSIAQIDSQLRLPAACVFSPDIHRNYGWVESVFPDENCFPNPADANPPAALDYWHAAGAMLCLAEHARLTDLHLGNIVATPAGPAVTDAECFATPMLRQLSCDKSSREQAPISRAIGRDPQHRTASSQTRLKPAGCLRLVRPRRACVGYPASSLVAVFRWPLSAHFRSRGTGRSWQRTRTNHRHRGPAANVEWLPPCGRVADPCPQNASRAGFTVAFSSGEAARSAHRAS